VGAQAQRWKPFRVVEGSDGIYQGRLYIAPNWAAVLLTGLAPAIWAWKRIRRRRRYSAGYCLGCGYDLRATPDRCPECGRAAKPWSD
jgi:hypothetical protein